MPTAAHGQRRSLPVSALDAGHHPGELQAVAVSLASGQDVQVGEPIVVAGLDLVAIRARAELELPHQLRRRRQLHEEPGRRNGAAQVIENLCRRGDRTERAGLAVGSREAPSAVAPLERVSGKGIGRGIV